VKTSDLLVGRFFRPLTPQVATTPNLQFVWLPGSKTPSADQAAAFGSRLPRGACVLPTFWRQDTIKVAALQSQRASSWPESTSSFLLANINGEKWFVNRATCRSVELSVLQCSARPCSCALTYCTGRTGMRHLKKNYSCRHSRRVDVSLTMRWQGLYWI
jgi:hypothetical protein